MPVRILKLLIFILILFNFKAAYSRENITLWTYYDFPPFSVDNDNKKGLTYDLASYLNNKVNKDDIQFVVKYLPRQRLNSVIANGQSGVVVWPTPLWFGDVDQSKYLWTETIIIDRNEVISSTDLALEYRSPESLKNFTFGTVIGHTYKDIQPLCDKKVITCESVYKEFQNLRKLVSGRIDVTIMASTASKFIIKNEKFHGKFYFSKTPHSKYGRKLMMTRDLGFIYPQLNRLIPEMLDDPDWQLILQKYGL